MLRSVYLSVCLSVPCPQLSFKLWILGLWHRNRMLEVELTGHRGPVVTGIGRDDNAAVAGTHFQQLSRGD